MCIIAAKPAGVPMPSADTIRNMWEGNPDGAGFMYPSVVQGKKGKPKAVVQVEKGFMTLTHFTSALEKLAETVDLTATPIVMHFRITTHGGTCPELTHPFPVTSSRGALRKLRATAPVGVAHNGIIHSVTPAKDMSDTSEYVATQLAPLSKALPKFWENPHALELIKNGIGSKMAILSASGALTTIGDFNEHDGVMYSNYSYEPRRFTYSRYNFGCGGWDYETATDYAWENASARKLMNLSEFPGAYVRLENGDAVDTDYNDGYAIDSFRTVYAYDEFLDCWIRLRFAEALTSTGTPLAYNAKAATWEDTITEEDAILIYDEIEADEAYDDAGLPDKPPFALT